VDDGGYFGFTLGSLANIIALPMINDRISLTFHAFQLPTLSKGVLLIYLMLVP